MVLAIDAQRNVQLVSGLDTCNNPLGSPGPLSYAKTKQRGCVTVCYAGELVETA
jgi:hypothetical protein